MSANSSELKARIEAERSGRPFLAYRDGDDQQRIVALAPGQARATVGREPSSDVALGWDDQVSRLHAELEPAGDGWTVVDDGRSRNGTFVNGERLAGRRRLADGDLMRFGSTTVIFRSPPVFARGGGEPPPPESLSTTQHRVLVALCRSVRDATGVASPPSDQQIAEELFLPVSKVRGHVEVLSAKFGVERLPADQRRIVLVERALFGSLVSEDEL